MSSRRGRRSGTSKQLCVHKLICIITLGNASPFTFGLKEIGNNVGIAVLEGRVQTYRDNLQCALKPDFSFPFIHSREVLLLILYFVLLFHVTHVVLLWASDIRLIRIRIIASMFTHTRDLFSGQKLRSATEGQ